MQGVAEATRRCAETTRRPAEKIRWSVCKYAEHNDLQKQRADLEKRLDDLQNSGQPEVTEKSSEVIADDLQNSGQPEATEKSSEVIAVLEHVEWDSLGGGELPADVMSSGYLLRFCPSALDNVVRRQEARETEETTCGSSLTIR